MILSTAEKQYKMETKIVMISMAVKRRAVKRTLFVIHDMVSKATDHGVVNCDAQMMPPRMVHLRDDAG